MKNLISSLIFLMISSAVWSQADQVSVVNNADGSKLLVNDQEIMINGMNWDYIPIGTNAVNANFWNKPDQVIRAGLDKEMLLLRNMNVNAIRQYTGVPARWIKYIYENYGIYTMLNHSFGRYGLTINGAWVPVTDYADPVTQELLLTEMDQLVKEYKDTPGLLLYLLGNENNYGLFWAGAETESFPDEEEKKQFVGESRGRPMYRLMNEAAKLMKAVDSSHPVAICNGDVLFIDIIAEECKDIDIYGTNTYRGTSFGDMFKVVKDKLNKPILFTEFGSDAFNAVTNEEDQFSQAFYMVENWKEIYQNASGLGLSGNSIGGFTFQFSDGWWKFGFDDRKNADIHDNNASWSNGGYYRDYVDGENNMNEEWFGICAKGPTSELGIYDLYPRAAYYALKEAHTLNPYDPGTTAEVVGSHFSNIQLMDAVLRARGSQSPGASKKKVSLSSLRAEFSTFNTGGSLLSTPDAIDPNKTAFPNQLGFDHMQSYFIGVEGNPTANMRAEVNFNILGKVAGNPIDEIFYENRARPVRLLGDDGVVDLSDVNRVQVYNAEFEWTAKDFDARAFYRTGHYHWGYQGDFFGLYPEANYGPNLDIYNGEILGMEIDGKKALKGFKLAFGPQLWWGANPAVLLKYRTEIGKYHFTGIFHEDIDEQSDVLSSIAIPLPKTRRATIALEREFGPFEVHVGGIWGGQPLNGRVFQVTEGEEGNYTTFTDEIKGADNWGGKFKVTYSKGTFNWYAQGAAMGLVANAGADGTQTFTGWKLKDTGSGNQTNILTGFTFNMGDLQIAPNFLWQKPIVAAMPNGIESPGRLRNIQDDPFAVRGNREMVAGELLLTYDPTPETWMYSWDNDMAEDAKFAFNLGFVFRSLPTEQDAAIGFLGNRTSFAFANSVPAQDLWEVNSRIVSKINPQFGLIANLYGGNAQANGSDERLIERFGGDVRLIHKKVKLTTMLKVNDWGPFDYHRDFNLTYPLQITADLSTSLSSQTFLNMLDTRMGIRYTWRSLNEYSPRYCPTMTLDGSGLSICETDPLELKGFDNGKEWEIRTYVRINIGK